MTVELHDLIVDIAVHAVAIADSAVSSLAMPSTPPAPRGVPDRWRLGPPPGGRGCRRGGGWRRGDRG